MLVIAFRVDASIDIGSGHVMRCLTLANALRQLGAECVFICREHPGNLIEHIRKYDFEVYTLPVVDVEPSNESVEAFRSIHSDWLGSTWMHDATASLALLNGLKPHWFIVDHYALDEQWESFVRPYCSYLGVIDDLHDRHHNCDLLVDQTLGLTPDIYAPLVPTSCDVLTGAIYALLRPEFKEYRLESIKRRDASPKLKHIFVNLGGVDKNNITSRVLSGIDQSVLLNDCKITVVMGATSQNVEQVKAKAEALRMDVTVLVGANNMAELMSEADLAIGAAGSTTWERCCLGLPSIMVVLAENQRDIAEQLSNRSIADVVFNINTDFENNIASALNRFTPEKLDLLSHASRRVTDGGGATFVAARIFNKE
ncbi:UDP-2,4-diacetamido-2,4,6-trideoxy-beta-L-altropyranose hydrolase [Aliamphritea ceti]|uniref:UDP-2,4-diacetamido-2,4, 6-trideoxy-beta-L-altropyranose hydrolase n=1 Tax=Aliamphritea ceti TaxID=1524258 RepID=UPI0021C25836|nr:UDP-2,4-diacetamido-2,4,6-trideoxy-beta-L-altropyranose hydrolase [Aliamphritea ceti]